MDRPSVEAAEKARGIKCKTEAEEMTRDESSEREEERAERRDKRNKTATRPVGGSIGQLAMAIQKARKSAGKIAMTNGFNIEQMSDS